jgi:glycosyltransferase involved in cell wall biosynthesis
MINDQRSKILFISTYTPSKCGIASFTHDLVYSIRQYMEENVTIQVCALDKPTNETLYKAPVSMLMDGQDLQSCIDSAAIINADKSIKLVCIEHEFGLYGGEFGEYLLGFLALLDKPFVIRFHTVLPNPGEKMLKIVHSISMLAEKVIVMTKHSVQLLREHFGIAENKIVHIVHGTHNHSTTDPVILKAKYDLAGKKVLTTFGLLSPNKGIEKGIIAMKQISAEIPEAVYVVLGQTHPNLLAREGEVYREYLQQLIIENGLESNVRLINEYVPTAKLMEYLALTDIYLFTSKDPLQAVSGTFLYAMSAGCAIISNAFVLATEMLDAQTGIILKPGNENDLAENAIKILHNPTLQKQMSASAFSKTRNTTWENVGREHAKLFSEFVTQTTEPFQPLQMIKGNKVK